jgi:nitrite reductase/ring-hydroxylating ferredoxin subunit
MVEVDLGPVADLPEDRCVAVGDGRAVAVRVGDEVRVFANRCLHQDSPLAGGIVLRGDLVCPQHFWRYRLPAGEHPVGGCLPSYPVHVVDGRAVARLPEPEPVMSMRERLLAHAHDWDRGD